MKEAVVVEEENFVEPLGLLGFRRVQISYDGEGELLVDKQIIQVPGKTTWVCFELTDVDIRLAPTGQDANRYLNSLRLQAVVDELSRPMLKFSVRAQMMSEQQNDHWAGTILLTILCFG